MNEYEQKRLDDLSSTVQELLRAYQISQAQLKRANEEIQENRDLLEKLAVCLDLEYSQDARDWANRGKLADLKKNPREKK